MKNKLSIINHVFKNYNTDNYVKLMVFTKGFTAVGEYVEDSKINKLLILKDVKVYSAFSNCECETTSEYRNLPWLNIFYKDVVGFSYCK